MKIGYFTTLTVIYLTYLRWMTLEMDDNDDLQSPDGAETAQSHKSGSQSSQLGITVVSEHEVIDEVRAMGFLVGYTSQVPELLVRLSPGARQFVHDCVASGDPGEQLETERIGPSEEKEYAMSGRPYDRLGVPVVLVLVLNKDPFTIKRMLTLRHPYTRVSFICQCLQSDTGKHMLSPPQVCLYPSMVVTGLGRGDELRHSRRE